MNVTNKRNIHRSNLPFLLFICLASALGGLLWGFDAIVISGTIPPVKEQFALGSGMEGFFVSSGLLGAVIGSGLAGWLADRFGRSRNLLLAAVLLAVSAAGSAWAPSIGLLIFARWIGGIGVGISAMVCPLYISEISPAHLRGRLVTVFQFAITIGILIALVSNAWLHDLAEKLADTVNAGFWHWFLVSETWRAMFAVELIPGAVFLLLALFLPESPRWLVKRGRGEDARRVLGRVLREGAEAEVKEIQAAIAFEQTIKSRFASVLQPRFRKPLTIAILLAVFAQWSGINVIFYYGPSVLEQAGFEIGGALSGFATIGFFNMIFTVVAMMLVDKLGRRPLMIVGTLGAMVCLIGIGLGLGTAPAPLLIAMICGFVAFFAFSLGPVKFIFASEIFPTNIRSHAMAVVVLALWLSDTIVGQVFPLMRDAFGASTTFFLFAAIITPQLWMVWKAMPETAGRSLEEIEGWYREGAAGPTKQP